MIGYQNSVSKDATVHSNGQSITLSPDKLVYKLDANYIAQQLTQQALMIVSSPKQLTLPNQAYINNDNQNSSNSQGNFFKESNQTKIQSNKEKAYQELGSNNQSLEPQNNDQSQYNPHQKNQSLVVGQTSSQIKLLSRPNENYFHQSSQPKNVQPQSQFQHVMQNLAKQPLPHQVGINGLLNMTKQRGLVNNQIGNQAQSSNQIRSQSSQKGHYPNPSFQNNGKLITQKQQSSLSMTTGVASNSTHSSYNTYNMEKQMANQTPYNKIKNPQYHYASTMQNVIAPSSFSIVPVGRYHQQQLQFLHGAANSMSYQLGQAQMGRQMQNGMNPMRNNNFFFYDQPVSINGRQINFPASTNNYEKVDSRQMLNIKKGGSAGFLNSDLFYNANNQRQSFNNEMMRNLYFQELLESQGQAPLGLFQVQQLSGQQDLRNLPFSSIMNLQAQNPPQIPEEETLRRVKHSIQPYSMGPRKSKIPFANAYVEDCYKFVVIPGNNSGLIRKALERREWWIEIPPVHSLYNFKWQPVSYGIKFESLSHLKQKSGETGITHSNYQNHEGIINSQSDKWSTRQMVNHFEFHHLITEKANLFQNLKLHCENQKENIFDICPLTFYVEVNETEKSQSQQNQSLQQFINVYQQFEDNREKIKQIELLIQDYTQQRFLKKDEQEKEEDETDNVPTSSATGDQSNSHSAKIDLKEKEFLSSLNSKTQNEIFASQKVTKFKAFNFEKRSSTKFVCPLSHFNGYNLWLLKPTHLNRGRGIHVFRDLDDLHRLIKEYTQGKDEEVKVQKKTSSTAQGSPQKNYEVKGDVITHNQDLNDSSDQLDLNNREEEGDQEPVNEEQSVKKKGASPKKGTSNGVKIKHNTFIIQKYIEKPLLLYGRKFDIRVWVLLNQDYDIFMFKEGYLRTSSSEFSIDLKNVDDQYVHLTNNAVQKYSEKYGSFEDGNQLGYNRFQQILNQQHSVSGEKECPISVREDLVPQMKELIIKSMYSVRKKIDPHRRKHCFELFGYDFILDADFNVWLIEINTNPCIEESSELLKVYLPRMIEDMLRLTIDHIFPKIRIQSKKKQNMPSSPQKGLGRISQLNQAPSALEKIDESANERVEETDNAQQEEQKLQEEQSQKAKLRIHPVEGYSNTESMWEKIWNLDRAEPPPSKNQNFRSEFIISVNNKQFKIKKNPLFKRILKESKQDSQREDKEELNDQ